MPATYQVRLTAMAGTHLQEIYDYIEEHSPQNTREMVRRLLDSIDSLEFLPHRYVPVRPFRVRYHVNDSTLAVTVLSVQHGARQDQ